MVYLFHGQTCRANAGPGAYSIPKDFHLPHPNTFSGLEKDQMENHPSASLVSGLLARELPTEAVQLLVDPTVDQSQPVVPAHVQVSAGETVDTVVIYPETQEVDQVLASASVMEEHVDRLVQLSTLNRGQRPQMDLTHTIQIHQLHQ